MFKIDFKFVPLFLLSYATEWEQHLGRKRGFEWNQPKLSQHQKREQQKFNQ
jgi:hypothetical protein